MIANPKPGRVVQVWYREAVRASAPYHGRLGTVITPGHGKPRNHLVRIDGAEVVVPCGNLRLPDECPGHGRRGTRPKCCDRAGEYNGFDSGPLLFCCPNHCSCHD